MIESEKVRDMPSTAKAAQFIMMIQGAFGIVSAVAMIVLLVGAHGDVVPSEIAFFFLSVLLVGAALLAGWTAGKWISRGARVWTTAVLIEGFILVGGIAMAVPDAGADLGFSNVTTFLMPAAVLVLLFLPRTRSWFDR
ncbi:hypothetical protein ACFOWE_32770 [Planomonospora corallina]|uniref:Integral membrane protein n=1 Tax=Planomonospora corallina TaxID=1806052 RepID=A0ABV8IGF7_9ACTN